MPRLPRKIIKTKFVHVIVQGINQEFIFQKDEQKQAYKYLLKKNLANTGVQVLAYCIMGNHAHILLYSDTIEMVTNIMHNTNTSYAKMYNKMNKRKGYVFRDRYSSQMILSKEHLFNCIVYIHNNPVKAGIISNPEQYQYSSYNEFIGKRDILTKKSIEIIFEEDENFIDRFYKMHKRENIEDIIEVNDMTIDSKEIIDGFTKKYNKKINDIVNDNTIFCELLLELRYDGGLSLREMSEIFKINKDKLNRIININIWEGSKSARQKPRPIV